jgi:hypothetical protein
VNLEAIITWAQLIAAVGVIGSLFYLGLQIRQNTRPMRAFVADWHGASEDDRARALPLLFATFKLFENAWFQQRQGTLDPQQWEGWDAYIRMYYHRPGAKTWWQTRRAAFAAGFRDYIEASQPIKDLPPIDRLIRGRNMIVVQQRRRTGSLLQC